MWFVLFLCPWNGACPAFGGSSKAWGHPLASRSWIWGQILDVRDQASSSSYFSRIGIRERARMSVNSTRYSTGQIPALRPPATGSLWVWRTGGRNYTPPPPPLDRKRTRRPLYRIIDTLQLRGVRGLPILRYLFWLYLGRTGSSLSFLKCGNYYPAHAKPTKLG